MWRVRFGKLSYLIVRGVGVYSRAHLRARGRAPAGFYRNFYEGIHHRGRGKGLLVNFKDL